MVTTEERRAPHNVRVPFDAMVEVGGALGPSFEAQAVNLSEDGMHLRTAYLPEIGQPITCRFDAGQGLCVLAAGEVLWREDQGEGGEFGIRFTNLDAQSTVALSRILSMCSEGTQPDGPDGRRVSLHIDGLKRPMRAWVRGPESVKSTAYSELGFLQIGKAVEMEDDTNGARRPATIERVEIELGEARIPELVIGLRYDDAQAHEAELAGSGFEDHAEPRIDDAYAPMPAHTEHDDEDEEVPPAEVAAKAVPVPEEEEPAEMKSKFAQTAEKARVGATQAFETMLKRAKTTMALIAARAARKNGDSGDDVEIPMRRMTAPPPDGALHASGRKVVRGEIGEKNEAELVAGMPKMPFKMTKKKAVVAGAIGVATILAFVAFRSPSKPAPAPVASTSAVAPPAAVPAPMPMPANDPQLAAASGMDATGKAEPFGNGPVGNHTNVLKIKMDGPIGKIDGATQPTGFTVTIPGRKSVDAAGPLAAKDNRIAGLRVANEQGGAELSVTFKDGVPNYQVRAHKDILEIVLQKPTAEAKASHGSKKHGGKKH